MRCYVWILMLALLTIGGCDRDTTSEIPILRVSALPDQAPDAVREQHALLIQYICETAQIACQWEDSANYKALVDRFGQGEIDLAYFGGVTFVFAHERYGAVPLVMRDIDTHFTSSVYVNDTNSIGTLQELRDHTFSFGPRQSTSGHIMPRYYMRQAGIEPEVFFSSITYSKGHDNTLERIESGKVEAGVVNSHIAKKFHETHAHNKLQLVWETPPYIDYVWAVRADIGNDLRHRLQDAFLGLRLTVPSERIILDQQGTRGYLPASVADFEDISNAMKQSSPERKPQ